MCQALSEHQQQNVYCNSIITKKGENSISISIKKPQKTTEKVENINILFSVKSPLYKILKKCLKFHECLLW